MSAGDKTETAKLADQTLTLLLDCGASARRWMEFYIAVQTALAVATGAGIAFWRTEVSDLSLAPLFLVGGVATLAITVGNTLARIILREYSWQAYFVSRLESINEGETRHVFPRKEDPDISQFEPGFIGVRTRTLNRIVLGFWIFLAGLSAAFVYVDGSLR